MKRSRGRLVILTLAVACAGTAAGTTFALADKGEPDPLTRADVYHKGMSLEEVARAATGKPGEIAPPCPTVDTAQRLKEQGVPFGPCDLVPEEGAPVVLGGPEEEAPPDDEFVCAAVELGKGLLEVTIPCGRGAEILDVSLVEVRGRPCADISYRTEQGSEARRETLCEGDVPKGGTEPVRGPSHGDDHDHEEE